MYRTKKIIKKWLAGTSTMNDTRCIYLLRKLEGFSSHPHVKSPTDLRLLAASKMRGVPPQMLELVAGLGEVWSAQTLAAYLKTTGIPGAEQQLLSINVVKFHGDLKHDRSPPQMVVNSKGHVLTSGKPRLVKYYVLIWPHQSMVGWWCLSFTRKMKNWNQRWKEDDFPFSIGLLLGSMLISRSVVTCDLENGHQQE